MTNVSDIYTLWLKPHHLPVGKAVEVTIEKVEKRTIHPRPTEEKEALILTFAGRNRKMILNPTNANKMTDIGGEDYSAWRGLVIQLKRAQHTKDKETIHVIPASKIEVPPVVKEAVKPASDKATEPVTLPEPQPTKANGDKPLASLGDKDKQETPAPPAKTNGGNGHTDKPLASLGDKPYVFTATASQKFWDAVQEATNKFYKNPPEMIEVIGGWFNFGLQDLWDEKLSAAVDHARIQREAHPFGYGKAEAEPVVKSQERSEG